MRRIIKKILGLLILVALVFGISWVYRALPIISGFGAQVECSCVFNSDRNAADVTNKELQQLPLSLGTYTINLHDSSASGSVFGLAKRKSIYRKGLGCTLIDDISEQELRSQKFDLIAPLKINQDTINWPLGNRMDDTIMPSVDYTAMNKIINAAFAEPGSKPLRNTRAIIVVYNGKIIAEKYAEGFTRQMPQTGWSMTKSVTNALIGILVKQGKIKVTDKNLFTNWQNDKRKNITINNLLQASSGLEWQEVYTSPSAATNMLFRKDSMGQYARSLPLNDEPGKHFNYSSGTANILSLLIRQHTGNDYYCFPYDQLFYKIGMYSAVLEPDAGGTFVGSSYCFATARDWARFGLLYLQDGVWNGERILPQGWIKYTTTPAAGAPMGEYGAQFWLNAGAPGNPAKRKLPDVPVDCFYADGYEGQFVWIIPSKKLVVVKLSMQHGNELDNNHFLATIIKAIH